MNALETRENVVEMFLDLGEHGVVFGDEDANRGICVSRQ
jgi:hypothetical protein